MSATTVRERTHKEGSEKELWKRLSEHHDPLAREELVRLYLPVARRMAARYAGVAEPYDDLVQVASLGLLNAIDRFDPGRGTPFLGFAKPTIMGELKRHFRDRVWTVRVPRSVHDLMARIEKATEELEVDLGRSPSVGELTDRLGAEVSDVLEALEAQHNRRALSLDTAPSNLDEEGPGAEWVGDEDPGYELTLERLMLRSILPALDEREADILRLRFVEELPRSEIAWRLGCSQMHISRLLRRALERLREAGEGDGETSGGPRRPSRPEHPARPSCGGLHI